MLWSSFFQLLTLTSQFLLEYCPSLLGVLGIQSSLFSLGMADLYCWQKAIYYIYYLIVIDFLPKMV